MDDTIATMKTISQLAQESGRPRQSLARAALKLGLAKTGRDYLLSEKQAAKLLASIRDKPGCPLFGTVFVGRKANPDKEKRPAAKESGK